ncbi:helix-turn-helix domain-containing protein [Chelatococcus reniformis]|uniref:AraC family transcriptional regulator n=1 Tax=Chelatococcus reniformis TaxID=1494448 RepID=A0A916X6Q8_9HYPH|nr:helix-turn-helix domain-containing protein [Chelatococcus reniformis]GGC47151.1 AraC family transcriptional regulator [Chelatococcus reniformis]
MAASAETAVPTFYLYGEAHRAVDDGFIHVESLDDRSRPSGWTIRPHAHAELNHLFHIATGGGTMRAETRRLAFVAPCLLLIAAGTVHGFRWQAESSGSVVTVATAHLQDLVRHDEDLRGLFGTAAVVPLDQGQQAAIAAAAARLMQELGWAARGHRAAADAGLLDLMVTALRARHAQAPDDGDGLVMRGAQAELVARLRQRVQERFRLRESVEAHARALGVTPGRLRAACARVARQAPSDMLDQRALLEAKRALLYSNAAVAEIGYGLGFPDPAYFSRFFTRHVGQPPSAFRAARGD